MPTKPRHLSLILSAFVFFYPPLIYSKLSCEAFIPRGTLESNLKKQEKNRDVFYYADQMDASLFEKLSKIQRWILSFRGSRTLDIGTGTGSLLRELAKIYPESYFAGLDLVPKMLEIARKNTEAFDNVSLYEGSALKLPVSGIDTIILNSVLHEIRSYGKSKELVLKTLRESHSALNARGRVVIRDFVRPENGDQEVVMSHAFRDMQQGQTFSDFVASSPWSATGHEVGHEAFGPRYQTTMKWAYEYMFRKDYRNNWRAELEELYGFWSLSEAVMALTTAGFSVIHVEKVRNDWIIKNRLQGKIKLEDLSGSPLEFPDYQIIIVGEKRH